MMFTRDSALPSDYLIVVPPFCNVVMPSLAAHIVQDTLARKGIRAPILYANLLAAKAIGFNLYHLLAESNRGLVCERIASLCLHAQRHPNVANPNPETKQKLSEDISAIIRDSQLPCDGWSLDGIFTAIANLQSDLAQLFQAIAPRFVAFTCTFQTIGSVELVSEILKMKLDHPPHVVVGGSNTEGEMAEGLLTFFTHVDHVFSGDVGQQFASYCLSPDEWRPGITRSIELHPPHEGLLDYREFYNQSEEVDHPRMDQIWLPFETSRGCWFGEKSHCTFCGLNGNGIQYRAKLSASALSEYYGYKREYRPKGFFSIDNIIPREFFSEFLQPIATDGEEKPDLFYEVKSNLTFEEIELLRLAGSSKLQPGIEGLSTPLLKHMRKGTSAFINLRTLFWSKQIGIRCVWNLLAHFPGDKQEWYGDTLRVLPIIRHLQPPQAVSNISIDRFSPLFERAAEHGVSNVRPMRWYNDVFGGQCDLQKLAYHFEADFESGYSTELENSFEREVLEWTDCWSKRRPAVEAFALEDGQCIVVDTRGSVNESEIIVDERGILLDYIANGSATTTEEDLAWLRARGLVLEIEGRFVNLVERLHRQGSSKLLPFTVGRTAGRADAGPPTRPARVSVGIREV